MPSWSLWSKPLQQGRPLFNIRFTSSSEIAGRLYATISVKQIGIDRYSFVCQPWIRWYLSPFSHRELHWIIAEGYLQRVSYFGKTEAFRRTGRLQAELRNRFAPFCHFELSDFFRSSLRIYQYPQLRRWGLAAPPPPSRHVSPNPDDLCFSPALALFFQSSHGFRYVFSASTQLILLSLPRHTFVFMGNYWMAMFSPFQPIGRYQICGSHPAF